MLFAVFIEGLVFIAVFIERLVFIAVFIEGLVFIAVFIEVFAEGLLRGYSAIPRILVPRGLRGAFTRACKVWASQEVCVLFSF